MAAASREQTFDFGPRWRSLRRLRIGKDEALAEIELDAQFEGDLNGIYFHPALLDMATGASLYLAENYDTSTALYLPIVYKAIRAYRPMPARFFSFIRPRSKDSIRGEVVTFDITLIDPEHRLIGEIEGFGMRRIPEELARALYEHGGASDTPTGGGEGLIEIPEHPAIAPADGVPALMRILQSRSPVAVVAVPQPLNLIAKSAPWEGSRPAPTLAAAPSTQNPVSVEAMLALWWQELLGVEQVGPDDDFFALGGHFAYPGVRLFARIRKTHQRMWIFELAVLFEARTIRGLAEDH